MKSKNTYRAFTLIELIMVMVLLSIVMVTAFINISSYRTQHLYAAAERVADDLRYAKNLALTTTKWHGVIFSAGGVGLIEPAFSGKSGAAYAFGPPPPSSSTTTTTTLPPAIPPSSLSLGQNQYAIFVTNGITDTIIKKPEDSTQDYIINVSNDYPGVTISSVNIDGINRVEFSPLGVPYTDTNANPISSIGIITLSGGGSTVTVRIAPESGRVYVQ
jgi:prepilin-type N-terminal cleavage/methylation domain-containing protein